MSEAIKPTPGEWIADIGETAVIRDTMGNQLAMFTHMNTRTGGRRNSDEVARNTRLAAEAGTVHHETGLTPRQLVERVKELEEALTSAQQAINSMKVEAETAAQGDEQMMLEACETISNEGLDADMEIRDVLDKALPNAAAKEAGK